MKDRILTSSEVMHIQYNIGQIERQLGHPIPSGLLDMSELTKNLSSYEIDKICYNIRQIEYNNRIGKYHNYQNYPVGDSKIEMIIGFTILLIGALMVLFS